MSDKSTDHPRQTSRRVAVGAIGVVAFVILYLIGFLVASALGPGLKPPVSSVLEVVYWPLIKCDENNIEPFHSAIEWLRHGRRQPPPGSGKTMTTPSAPAPPSR